MRTERETLMYREAAQAPEIVSHQLGTNCERIQRVGRALREFNPRAVVTCARGSSDHAATFARYLIETRTGVFSASTPPSVSSVYAAKRDLRDVLFLAISQSGASPDLIAAAENAKACGARVIALVNQENSPLAAVADFVVGLHAGVEAGVAATKSFIATLSCIVQLVSSWVDDRELTASLEQAPGQLEQAWQLDWSAAIPPLVRSSSLYVLARGLGLGVACEAALKLKETCSLHAESFSTAEVRHGPMTIAHSGFPVLVFTQADLTREGVLAVAAELASRDARVFVTGAAASGTTPLPAIDALPAIEPMLLAQSFYRFANALALARGVDPDHPPHLKKITETV